MKKSTMFILADICFVLLVAAVPCIPFLLGLLTGYLIWG